jgi:hypothetical protein
MKFIFATDETRIEHRFLKSFCNGRLGQLAFEFPTQNKNKP